jgi:hypothetical protein
MYVRPVKCKHRSRKNGQPVSRNILNVQMSVVEHCLDMY